MSVIDAGAYMFPIMVVIVVFVIVMANINGKPDYTTRDFCRDQGGIYHYRAFDGLGEACDLPQSDGTYLTYRILRSENEKLYLTRVAK